MGAATQSGRRCGAPPLPVSDDIDAFSPEEVHALVARRVRAGCRAVPDGCVHRAADGRAARAPVARRRLRGEAIRVRRSYNAHGGLGTPKSGSAVGPAGPRRCRGARAAWRARATSSATKTSCSRTARRVHGRRARCVTATRPALERAGLRRSGSTTFATRSERWRSAAEVPAVQAWMGHADIQTTMRYVHHRDRGDEAKLLARHSR